MDIDEKKKLQTDILLMSEIGRQYDLYDPKQAKNVLLFMQKRTPLVSVRAESFLARVTLLAEPEAPKDCVCLLCGKNHAPTGIFCEVCQSAIERSVSADAKAAKEEEAAVEAEAAEEIPEEEAESAEEANLEAEFEAELDAELETDSHIEPETGIDTDTDNKITDESEPQVDAEEEITDESEPDYNEPIEEITDESEPQVDAEEEITDESEPDYDEPIEEIPDKDAEEDDLLPEPQAAKPEEPVDVEEEELLSEPDQEAEPLPTVDSIMTSEEIDESPIKGSTDPFEEEPRKRSKPPIALIIATILSLILLGYVVINILLPRYGINLFAPKEPEKEIVTEEAGQAEIATDFSSEEYTTEYTETIKVPIGMYDVNVGEYCGDSWNTELIDVMVYHVQNIADPSQYARLMVAPDGRIIGTGTLVNEEEPLKAYRVK